MLYKTLMNFGFVKKTQTSTYIPVCLRFFFFNIFL